ncbi:GNAT family N-acetyltransferase [Methylobacterium sp. J-076]|nr:GNAT family N-acetyltransferase [Methylobacterium sp. J-076]
MPGRHPMLTAEILPGLSDAESLWRATEAAPDCVATPYQRFAWVSAYLHETGEAASARVAVLRDPAGRVRMLLPLTVRRQNGLVLARTVGDTHANYHLPLFTRDAAAVPGEEIRAALVAAGRRAGIDAFAFSHQPRIWEGAPNPLALGGEPEASDAYGLVLGPDPDATAKRVFSADARKKLRSKEKRLTEALGPVEYRMAGDGEEARTFLAAFYRQKAARFAGMGVRDPYAPEAIRRFLDRASSGPDPAMEVHGLRVAATGRILAVFGGAVNATRYSGMMTSFDADPEVGRYSPGDLLLHHLVREQTGRGRLGFDLGVGEARYKASICDETIALVESVWPVTVRGHAFALVRQGLTRLKRRVKGDPRLFAAASRVRSLLRRGG